MSAAAAPRVSVVVASHERCRRLGALLDALGDQRCKEFEVIVVHDDGPESPSEALLQEHPLAAAGLLRRAQVAPGTGSAARMRNVGIGLARAPLVAFTDDDCRPDPGWLEALLAAAETHPTAIVQGRTRPDPREAEIFGEHLMVHTMVVEPPTPEAETCNVAYPRALLERIGGFDESFRLPYGEDVDLACRARRAGAAQVAAPAALVHHAIEPDTLAGRLRFSRRFAQLPRVVRRNPEYRRTRGRALRIFVASSHAWYSLAVVGLLLALRRRVTLLLVLPWLLTSGRRLRAGRPRWRRLLLIRAVVLGSDLAWACAGSVRHRRVFL